MPTVLILKGLPASGKSTFAKALVHGDKAYAAIYGDNWKRVNKDDIRAMLDNSKWSKSNEKFVLAVRDLIIVEALSAGKNVVVDDTNLNPKHEKDIRELTASFRPEVEVKFFDVPVEECIERDMKRSNSVGPTVIMRMHSEYLARLVPKHVNDTTKPRAIICDIDGTASHMNGRSPFEWHRVGEDTPDIAVRDILRHYTAYRNPQDEENTTTVIMLSGRDEVCRPETEKWLKDNGIVYDFLYMRSKDDNRKDNIIKRELFDKYIADRYNVLFVLDDRNQVVNMWREMGLKCLQVAEGNF